jgi:hypothetical protein
MKKTDGVLLLGFLIAGGVVVGSLTSHRVRQSASGICGRMMGWMTQYMPDQ